MALAVECSDCKKRYAVDDGSAGKRVKCRNCGNVFTAEPLAKPVAKVAGQAARPAATRPAGARSAPAVAGAAVGSSMEPPPLPPPPRPAPPLEDPPDFDALLALSAAEQSAPSTGSAPPPPPPMPQAFSPYAPPAPAYIAPAAAAASPTLPIGYLPRPRRPRSNMSVGMDNVTPWFILLFVGAKIFDVLHAIVQLNDIPEEFRRHLKVGPGAFVTAAFVDLVVFFAVVATLVWLATFITAKIMKFELPDSAYMKAAGVAAIPSVSVTLVMILPPNLFLAVFLILAIIPVTLWVLKFAFDMTWPEALIALAFTVPLYVVAQVIRVFILGAVMVGFGAPQTNFFGGNRHHADVSFDGSDSSSSAASGNSSFQPQDDTDWSRTRPGMKYDAGAEQVVQYANRVRVLNERNTERTSRETMLAEERQLRQEIEARWAQLASKPGYDDLFTQLDVIKQKFMALPSEQPDEAVFHDPTATAKWDAAAGAGPGVLGTEVSFREFKLRPPADAKLDLKGRENDPAGLTWRYEQIFGAPAMTVSVAPRRNAAQKQPWVMTQSFMEKYHDQERLFAIDATTTPPEPVVVGTINGLTFWRIESPPSSPSAGDGWIRYVTLDGDRWIQVVIRPANQARAREEFDLAAHTLRKAANEPHADPFSPAALVERLADDSTQAVLLLRRQDPAAEEALDAGLSSLDRQIRSQCAELLRTVATAKSVPALRRAVSSEDREVSEATRATLRRVAPKEFDAVAEALLDLKSDGRDKQKALAALAAAKPDDARRGEVATLLEDMLLNNKAGFVEKQVGEALSVWYGPNTVTRLLPLVSDGKRPWLDARDQAAMKALAATHDKRVVMPIMVPWLLKDTEHTVPALIELGPLAEDAIVINPVLSDPDPRVRAAASRVLEQIGTSRCLLGLGQAIHDRRGDRQAATTAAAAAKQAYDAVTARATAAKAATRPAGK